MSDFPSEMKCTGCGWPECHCLCVSEEFRTATDHPAPASTESNRATAAKQHDTGCDYSTGQMPTRCTCKPVPASTGRDRLLDEQFAAGALAELAHRGASAEGLKLAAHLFGVAPCDGCGYRKLQCRCLNPVPFAPVAVSELDVEAEGRDSEAINIEQIDTLRDIFDSCDNEWLLNHVEIKQTERRNFTVSFEKVNEQDMYELFGEDWRTRWVAHDHPEPAVVDLPPLPKAECLVPGIYAYRDNHMAAYARIAVMKDRVERRAPSNNSPAGGKDD